MEIPRVAGWRARGAAIGLAVLAIGLLIARLIETLSQPATDLATLYAAARAVADNRAANVYDPAAFAQLNATHQYVAGTLYPFAYPPFTLLIVRPLTLLSFDAARIVWICLLFAALIGASLLLAATWVRALRQNEAPAPGDLRRLVEASSLPIGKRAFPTLPFALTLAPLLLTLPLLDATYWGASTVVVLFFLALALYANAIGTAWLTGASLGLVAGFGLWAPFGGIPALACLAALAFVLRPPWAMLISTAAALAVVLLLPLVVVPLSAYGQLSMENTFFGEVSSTSLHNTSLGGFVSNLLVLTEHTGTTTFADGLKAAHILGIALLVVSVALVVLLAIFGEGRSTSGPPANGARHAWPSLAMLLAVSALAAPVVWPAEAVVTPLAAIILAGYGLAGAQPTTRVRLTVVVAGIALLLCVVAALSGIDGQYPPQATPAMLLTLLRPLAALLVWGLAIGITARATLLHLRQPATEPVEAQVASRLAAK